jgi:molybdate transport system regulatory protein
MESRKKLTLKSKIWIEDENGKMVFGAGRLRILREVERHGSILAAAKALNMSYRAAWGKIKATEDCLGQPLLTRQVGGASGGGSQLTPLAKVLIHQFKALRSMIRENADTVFQDLKLSRVPDDDD